MLCKNNWGVCILADLDCGEAETLFNLKINLILEDLEKDDRDYYITLIINAEFGFLKKLTGVTDDGGDGSEIRTVIYQNSATPEIKDFQDISQREIVKNLLTSYHIKRANSKFNAVITWGHGMAYSIFRKNSNTRDLTDVPTNEDTSKHFRMINDEKFKALFITLPTSAATVSDNNPPGHPHIRTTQSKDYLSMDELALAILGSFGRKIDLLVLSSCGMAYARTGITLSNVADYWIAGEQYTSDYAILPDNFLAALKNEAIAFSPKEFGKSLCLSQSNRDSSFRLYEMKHFVKFNILLRNFSKAVFVNIKSHSDLINDARNKCIPIGNPTHTYHLISFFDFCKQIENIDSSYSGIKFLKKFCPELQELRKNLIVTADENDTFGISIFFPAKSDILNPLSIDESIIIGIPIEAFPPVKYNRFLWEFNVLKLIEKK